MRYLTFAIVGLSTALMAWPQNRTGPEVFELGAIRLTGERRLGEFSGRGSWMRLREKNPGLGFKVYAQDQGGCETLLPELARGAVGFTLVNEEVDVQFYRFDVLCRQEADGGYFVLSVPNVGVSGRRGGVFCLFAYRVGTNGFSGPVQPVSQIDYCSSGAAENLEFVFLVKAGSVVGVLAEYRITGAHPPSYPYYSVLFANAGEQSAGGEPLQARIVATRGDVMAYVIDEDWRRGHNSGSKELQGLYGKRILPYGDKPFVLRRLWDRNEVLDCQILDTTKGHLGSPTPRDQSSRREYLLRHLSKLTGRLEQETAGKKMVVFPRD